MIPYWNSVFLFLLRNKSNIAVIIKTQGIRCFKNHIQIFDLKILVNWDISNLSNPNPLI